MLKLSKLLNGRPGAQTKQNKNLVSNWGSWLSKSQPLVLLGKRT